MLHQSTAYMKQFPTLLLFMALIAIGATSCDKRVQEGSRNLDPTSSGWFGWINSTDRVFETLAFDNMFAPRPDSDITASVSEVIECDGRLLGGDKCFSWLYENRYYVESGTTNDGVDYSIEYRLHATGGNFGSWDQLSVNIRRNGELVTEDSHHVE